MEHVFILVIVGVALYVLGKRLFFSFDEKKKKCDKCP